MFECLKFDFSWLLAFGLVDQITFPAGIAASSGGIQSFKGGIAKYLKLKSPDSVGTVFDMSALFKAFVVDNLHVVRTIKTADDEECEIVTTLKLL